jgi:hypothetical protein
MSKTNSRVEQYRRLYAGMRFERSALFELVREIYQPIEVLYPGCSIHLTPAFYFPHVCFVDHSPEAADFYADHEALIDYVRRQRTYRRAPYFQFLSQDFTQPLSLRENQFDLLLALFAGGVSRACKRYLKYGGLILTNNHRGDAIEAANDRELQLIAIVRQRQGKYRLEALEPGMTVKIAGAVGPSNRYLRQTSSGAEYIENERYYLFRKVRVQKKDG